jgi:hypothetical protein
MSAAKMHKWALPRTAAPLARPVLAGVRARRAPAAPAEGGVPAVTASLTLAPHRGPVRAQDAAGNAYSATEDDESDGEAREAGVRHGAPKRGDSRAEAEAGDWEGGEEYVRLTFCDPAERQPHTNKC